MRTIAHVIEPSSGQRTEYVVMPTPNTKYVMKTWSLTAGKSMSHTDTLLIARKCKRLR